jgi:hypothetical protein
MSIFPLVLSGLVLALSFLVLAAPDSALVFSIYALLLLENSFQLGKALGGKTLARPGPQDFRLRYAGVYGSIIYAFSLIIVFVGYSVLRVRNIFGPTIDIVAIILFGLLFSILRLGAAEASRYFGRSTLISHSDYRLNASLRLDAEAQKAETIKCIEECIELASPSEFSSDLRELARTLRYSSLNTQRIYEAVQRLRLSISSKDDGTAKALLNKINSLL